jgi:hypothetical protein
MAFLEIKNNGQKSLINIKDIILVQEDFDIDYSLIYIRGIEEPLKVKTHFSVIADKITKD